MKDDAMHSIAVAAGALCVLFLSTLTRSALGFGDALVAMPFLAILLGMQTAAPLVALVSTFISGVILASNWRIVDFRMTWRLIVAAACGAPLGLFYLTRVPEAMTQLFLGLLLVGFSLYNLRRPTASRRRISHHAAYAFGFAAGALGGAYNTVGPMLVLYGHLRGWPPEQFRATLQSCFLPAYGCIVIGHALAGLITPPIMQSFVLSLPLLGLAIYLGGRLHASIPQARFTRYINIALLLVGVFLCAKGYAALSQPTGAAPDAIQQPKSNKIVDAPHRAPGALALPQPNAISCVLICPDFGMAQGEYDAADPAMRPTIAFHPAAFDPTHTLVGVGSNAAHLHQQHGR